MSSPSEFLTFYRTATRASALRTATVSRTVARTRPFSSTIPSLAGSTGEKGDLHKSDMGGPKENKKHVLEKDYEPNVQARESKAGRSARANDTGGTATEQKDGGSKAKAKKEFPESPVQIGFEDERGGKGR
ncbi:hypothetical protein CERZMDRAFT_95412 [Cercospora zeae-maydis SCOH1-5]|uniref:Uncharacterized protein n=1 Tax=Cercospora zeae-maydis SCOH1-5 TaxID=717836 RepID=A0A6A6FNP9_9PEZI|nr:hypothetical protein CERZMDRAFT_95412 [Cercospora zeae-maydis SCOH1-5]